MEESVECVEEDDFGHADFACGRGDHTVGFLHFGEVAPVVEIVEGVVFGVYGSGEVLVEESHGAAHGGDVDDDPGLV